MSSQPAPSSQQPRPATVGNPGFVSDVAAIRERARRTMDEGAVTPSYDLDTRTVVALLNEALATEIVCTLRYRRHYYCAEGIHSESVKSEFILRTAVEPAPAPISSTLARA